MLGTCANNLQQAIMINATQSKAGLIGVFKVYNTLYTLKILINTTHNQKEWKCFFKNWMLLINNQQFNLLSILIRCNY